MGAMDTCRDHDVTYPADSGGFDRCPMCALEDRVKLLDAIADAALQGVRRR